MEVVRVVVVEMKLKTSAGFIAFLLLIFVQVFAADHLEIYIHEDLFPGPFLVKGRHIYVDAETIKSMLGLPADTGFPPAFHDVEAGRDYLLLTGVARKVGAMVRVNWETGIVDFYSTNFVDVTGPTIIIPSAIPIESPPANGLPAGSGTMLPQQSSDPGIPFATTNSTGYYPSLYYPPYSCYSTQGHCVYGYGYQSYTPAVYSISNASGGSWGGPLRGWTSAPSSSGRHGR